MIRVTLFALLLLSAPLAAQDTDTRVRAARLRAQAHIGKADWAAATAELERLAEVRPDDAYVLADLALTYLRQNRPAEAEALYRRLVRLHPDRLQHRIDLAYVLHDGGRFDEVCQVLETVHGDPGGVPDAVLDILADALERTGRGDRAEVLFETQLSRRPEDADLLCRAGEWHMRRGRAESARALFWRARRANPDSPRPLKGLAAALGESDPGQRRRYLTLALALDLSDPELPYLIAEGEWDSDRRGAIARYEETLRRLDQGAFAEPYFRRLEARVRYRLGERAAADSLMAVLVRQYPGDSAQRNDFADLLLENGRAEAALAMLPPGKGDLRSARLRASIYLRQHEWAAAAAALQQIATQTPGDVDLKLDLADALARAEQWQQALAVQREVLFGATPAGARERAYELRRSLRSGRGGAVGLTVDHVGLAGEASWQPGPWVRWHLTQSLAARLRWQSGHYRDDNLPSMPGFTGQVQQYSAEALWVPRAGLEMGLSTWGFTGRVDRRPGGLARGRLAWGAGGSAAGEVAVGELWREPVDAVAHRGLADRAQASVSLPLAGFYLQAQGIWRSLKLEETAAFGGDRRLSIFVARQILQRPYGARFAVRSLSLTLAHEVSESDQRARFLPLFELPPRTRVTTVGVYTHLLWGGRGHLDVAPFVGRDPDRGLAFGDLYGLSLSGQILVGRRAALRASVFGASESALQTGAGRYRNASVELVYYLDRDHDRSPPAFRSRRTESVGRGD